MITRESTGGLLLALLVVLSVVSVVPGSAAVTTAERSLDSDTVSPGGQIRVTLLVEFDQDHDRVTIQDHFSGPVASASIESVTVDGTERTPLISYTDHDTVSVTLENVTAYQRIEVTYTVNIFSTASDGDTVTFSGEVTAGNDEADFGSDTVSVSTGGDAPANFAVTIDSTTSPVNVSEPLTVTATVENTAEQEGTQTVALSINGTQVDATDVTLAGGASTTVTLSWPTEVDDAGSYTATVASANDSDSTTVSVSTDGDAPADFTGATADRSLDSDRVSPGGKIRVTLSVEFDEDHSSVSITDGFSGPVAFVSIDSVTVNGTERNPFFATANSHSVAVALRNVPAGQRIEVTYTVHIASTASDGDTVSFTGNPDDPDVTAGDDEADFGSDTVSVSTVSGSQGTAEFDGPLTALTLGTRGDVVEIPISLSNTRSAEFELDSKFGGYHVTMDVRDGDGDGQVTLLWDTSIDGQAAIGATVFSVASSSDEVTNVDFLTGRESEIDSLILAFDMTLSVNDTQTDFGFVYLTEPIDDDDDQDDNTDRHTAPADDNIDNQDTDLNSDDEYHIRSRRRKR